MIDGYLYLISVCQGHMDSLFVTSGTMADIDEDYYDDDEYGEDFESDDEYPVEATPSLRNKESLPTKEIEVALDVGTTAEKPYETQTTKEITENHPVAKSDEFRGCELAVEPVLAPSSSSSSSTRLQPIEKPEEKSVVPPIDNPVVAQDSTTTETVANVSIDPPLMPTSQSAENLNENTNSNIELAEATSLIQKESVPPKEKKRKPSPRVKTPTIKKPVTPVASTPKTPTKTPQKPPTKTSHKNSKIIQEQKQSIKDLENKNITLQEQLREHSSSLQQTTKAKQKVAKVSSLNFAAAREKQLRGLNKKIQTYKKANNELKKKLTEVYNSDLIVKLENASKEKEIRISRLVEENRALKNLQRSQSKQIEKQESLNDNLPGRLQSLMEELRLCKEKLRGYKEREKTVDRRSAKAHEQIVDLTKKNHQMSELLKQSEMKKASASTDSDEKLVMQQEELEKLKSRIGTLEKAKRGEKVKYEKVLKASQEQITRCKKEMQDYQAVFLEKEKITRHQVLQVKKLKRTLKGLVAQSDENHEIHQFLLRTTAKYESLHGKSTFRPSPPSIKSFMTNQSVEETTLPTKYSPSSSPEKFAHEEISPLKQSLETSPKHVPITTCVSPPKPEKPLSVTASTYDEKHSPVSQTSPKQTEPAPLLNESNDDIVSIDDSVSPSRSPQKAEEVRLTSDIVPSIQESKEEAALINEKAAKLQAIYRGYSSRKASLDKKEAEPHPAIVDIESSDENNEDDESYGTDEFEDD